MKYKIRLNILDIIILLNIVFTTTNFVIGDSACLLYQSPDDPGRPEPGYTGVTKCIACRVTFVLASDGYCYCP